MATPGRRMRVLARILRGEQTVTAATRRAIQTLLQEAVRALAASGYDTSVLDDRFPGWRAAVDKDVAPAIEAVFLAAWDATSRGAIDPTRYATRHLEAVHNRLVGVSGDVFDAMRLTLEEGRQAGDSIPALATRIDALLTDEQRWTNRAVTVARTEVISANNAGARQSAFATADLLGLPMAQVARRWMATGDSRTRESHREADGQVVFGDQPYTVGGAELLSPGDPNGPGEEVINCRCSEEFLLPGDPDYPGGGVGTSYAISSPEVALIDGGDIPGNAIQPDVTPTAPAARVPVVEPAAVDPGPQSNYERMARALTLHELAMEARRSKVPEVRRVARAELRRRGIAASAYADTEETPMTDDVCLVALPDPDDPVHGLGEEEKHATLLFLGDSATLPEGWRDILGQALAAVAAAQEPFTETVTGVEELGDDGALVWMLAGDTLPAVRQAIIDAAPEVEGYLQNTEQYPSYTPHVTIGYDVPMGADTVGTLAAVESIRFDRLGLWVGDDRGEVGLAGYGGTDDPANTDEALTAEVVGVMTAAMDPSALEEPTHAGIAVQAADTGRILMQQRSWDEEDAPEVRGTWEFPGGGLEDGETPEAGAWREWVEETGLPVPDHEVTGGWRSPDGVYQGFVATVPTETSVGPLNPDEEAAADINPDDPKRANPDVTAWFTAEQIQDMGAAVRPEVLSGTDWSQFAPTPAPEEAPMDTTPDPDLAAALDAVRRAGYAISLAEDPLPAPVDTPDAENPETPPDSAEAPPQEPDGEPFYGILWPEGTESGDRRAVDVGATTWRDLPLPIMAQDAQAPGHDGAVRVGRLDLLERDETTYAVPVIRYAGVWDTNPTAVETARQVDKGMVRGISTDGDAVTVELRSSDGATLNPAIDEYPEDGVVVEVATAARVSGGTVCSIPAFHQAYIANGTLADRDTPEPGWNEDGTPKDNVLAPPANDQVPEAVVASAWTLTAEEAIVMPASAFTRPASLDDNPKGTPLTVTDDGRVYGHLAVWGTCHIGIDGLCQEPPASATNYAYFATGSVPTDDGNYMPTGPLVMGTGHAALTLGHRPAAAHYDNTGTAVADVVMGQDHIGIWFAGCLRPGITPQQVYALRAAGKVSGDWRECGGNLELVAALVVNTPGFSIPRPALAASGGRAQAMVAAGMVQTPHPVETPAETQTIVDMVVAALDRRERATMAVSRFTQRQATARRARAEAARSRLTSRSGAGR